MTKISLLEIKNFRGIKHFKQSFFKMPNIICIVGRGDSGKTSLLEALSLVLYPNWNKEFYDTDFFNHDVSKPIEINVTLYSLPKELIHEDKYGLYTQLLNKESGNVNYGTESAEDYHLGLTVSLRVEADLEPKWFVVSNSGSEKIIKHQDRSRVNLFYISDYLDKHFSFSARGALYKLNTLNEDVEDPENYLIGISRNLKKQINDSDVVTKQFDELCGLIGGNSRSYGVNLEKIRSDIDFKDILIKDDLFCLHDNKTPVKLKGKGSKRLISIIIQMLLTTSNGIILIDEIEQGLESNRIKHLIRKLLLENSNTQWFFTSHSKDIILELECVNLLELVNNGGDISSQSINLDYQGIIRKFPEALYTQNLVVCEGSTEIGVCRALESKRVKSNKSSFVELNLLEIDGIGTNMFKNAKELKLLGKNICIFCDNDVQKEKDKKAECKRDGINIFEWDEHNNIEAQSCIDLPWTAITELIEYAKKHEGTPGKIERTISSMLKEKSICKLSDTPEVRSILKTVFVKNESFKRIDHGKKLGEICFQYIGEIQSTKLATTFKSLEEWIDNCHVKLC